MNSYSASLYLASELLAEKDSSRDIKGWFEYLMQNATDEHKKKAYRLTEHRYVARNEKKIKSYQKNYREKEKLRVLKND